MEDLDIIRHEPGSSPTTGRPTPVHGWAAEPDHGLRSPAIDRFLFLFVFFQDIVESTATSPPHLSLMLLHPRHLFHNPRHPFQEESAREQARHEESEAKLAEWWRRCDSPPFSQKLRESVCVYF